MPARLREIAQALSVFGIELRKPSSGSHYKLVELATGRSYTIPAHNGERTEIGDKYLRGRLSRIRHRLRARPSDPSLTNVAVIQ